MTRSPRAVRELDSPSSSPSTARPTPVSVVRRVVRILGALLAVSMVAGACAGDDDTDGSAGQDPSVEAADGGRLVIGVDVEADGFLPASSWSTGGLTMASAILESLMVSGPDNAAVPFLAETLEPNDDFTVWTMTLRPGIEFHDGTPFNADAVRLNVEEHIESPFGSKPPGLTGVTVIDDLTLTFDLEATLVSMPGYLSSSLGLMAAPSMLEAPDGSSNPVGTGPFVFDEWRPNDRFVVTKNANYWQEGLAHLDEVEFRPMPELQSRLSAIETGEIDATYAYGGDGLKALEDLGSAVQVSVVEEGPFLENYIVLNNGSAPFDNEHARRALAFATNRDRLNEVLERGRADLATGPFSGESQYPEPENVPVYDLEAAAEELALYKADTGEDLSFELSTNSTGEGRQEAELLQDMWRDAGIDVSLRQIESAELVQTVFGGDYQAIPWAFDAFVEPDQQAIFWASETVNLEGFGTNFARFTTPRIDELLAEGRVTVDAEERFAVYGEIAQIIVDEVPWVYTTRQLATLAAAPHVVGLGEFSLPDGGKGIETVPGVIRVGSLARAGG